MAFRNEDMDMEDALTGQNGDIASPELVQEIEDARDFDPEATEAGERRLANWRHDTGMAEDALLDQVMEDRIGGGEDFGDMGE